MSNRRGNYHGIGGNQGKGAHWIRDAKRLAIYARDGHRCLWCQTEVRRFDNATLDHYVSRAEGGTHHSSNLLTSCSDDNQKRQHMSAVQFASQFPDPDAVLSRIAEQLRKPIDYPERHAVFKLTTSEEAPF